MLNHFIHSREPIICHEVLKENLQTFEKPCILAERILYIASLIGSGSPCGKFRWLTPTDYGPMDLDSVGAWEYHCQPNKGGRNNQNNKPRPTFFFVAIRVIFLENAGITHLDYPIFIFPTTSKNIGEARFTF